jgi:hypothetical protein
MRNSSYKQIKGKQQKLRSIDLATEDTMRLRRPELHNDAPKEVMTQQAPSSPRPHRSRVFTRSPDAERITTTTPPRGSRRLQASPSLAPKRWDFSQKNPRHTWYLRLLAIPEPSFYHAIWALTTPKRHQHQELPMPTPRHPHGPKRRPPPPPRHPSSSCPCSPPSRAAAPAPRSCARVARSIM